MLAGSVTAKADNVHDLEASLRDMQRQMEVLQRQVDEAKASAAAAEAAAQKKSSSSGSSDWKVKWKGAPEFSSKDGRFTIKPRGRLQVDYDAIDQDQAITGDPDVSAIEIRRAWLGVEGIVWGDTFYRLDVDFANNATAIKDAYLEYRGLMEDLGIRVGNFKTFNSLEHITSSNYTTFMERAAFIETFGIDRQIGAAAVLLRHHYTLAAGIFGPRPDNDETWMNDVKTGAARVTVAPINDGHTVLHLGASWRLRNNATGLRSNPNPVNDELFLYRARGADLHLANRFVSTPQIFDEDTFWGAEAAFIWGPWSVQSEYGQLNAGISQAFAGIDPNYYGWYVEGSWFVTGETRPYKDGEIGRTKVARPVWEGGPGAWQLAAKYDVINLDNNAEYITTCSECGEQRTWLLGVNWWLNDNVRIMFDFNQSKIGGGFMNGANVNNGATIRGFGTRAQVDW
jgi:phosphate-selective porin OprO/OprP